MWKLHPWRYPFSKGVPKLKPRSRCIQRRAGLIRVLPLYIITFLDLVEVTQQKYYCITLCLRSQICGMVYFLHVEPLPRVWDEVRRSRRNWLWRQTSSVQRTEKKTGTQWKRHFKLECKHLLRQLKNEIDEETQGQRMIKPSGIGKRPDERISCSSRHTFSICILSSSELIIRRPELEAVPALFTANY